MSEISKVYEARPIEESGRDAVELACYDLLEKLQIPFRRVDHEAAQTMEDCVAIGQVLGGEVCKNLFLCNRQQTQFYLLLMEGEKKFHTKDLSSQLGVSRLSFAGPEHMQELLGVRPGSASVLGLQNDLEGKVRLLIDKPLLEKEWFGCHPCRNTSTLLLRTKDVLEQLIPALCHPYTVVDLPADE